jgi:hypothetical protein
MGYNAEKFYFVKVKVCRIPYQNERRFFKSNEVKGIDGRSRERAGFPIKFLTIKFSSNNILLKIETEAGKKREDKNIKAIYLSIQE